MPNEQERKWIVPDPPSPDMRAKHDATYIYQPYVVVTEDREVRIREKHKPDGSTERTLGIKKGKGENRGENEIAIGREQFLDLKKSKEGHVEKLRYEIPKGEHLIEVDVYKGDLKGLTVAEVEDPEGFEPPEWFGAEVTENEAYKNKWLATEGIPT